ncbi:MAG: transglutaminase domain-containing protein [Bacteroidota bacterium]
MKFLTFLLLFTTFSLVAFSQNFRFGQITADDYAIDKNKIDSSANAIVIQEFGKSTMLINESDNRIDLLFEYHVKIKILNKDGFNQANILIPTYIGSGREEYLSQIKASTYNYNSGTFVETVMDSKAMFTEQRSKYIQLTKFTLPNIKEGSIIEYSYRLETPNIFNFKPWNFQSDIPKISSAYEVNIPAVYNYNVVLRGPYKLTDQKVELVKECMRINGASIDCSKITYSMAKIPAFVEEDYMTAASNFKSAIYFELSDMQRIDGSRQAFTKAWKDIDYELINSKSFGTQMKRKDAFKEILPNIIKGATTDLDKAKAIYNYVKKQIKWNNYSGIHTEENIKTVLGTRSGNVADINLGLIAALSAASLDAEAVILSTRDQGVVNKIYSVISEFNYVVAKVNIGTESYLLDATEPLLPFGLLPVRCINDQGRVINLKKPSYWIDLKASQKSVTSYILDGTLTKDGKIKGTIIRHSLGYDAFNKRKEIKRYNSIEEYVEKLDEKLSNLTITSEEILNIDSLDNPLTEKYGVEFSAHDATNATQLYINPFFINRITKNPFNLNERTYPVDLGSASDERIIITINLPEKYDLIDRPKDLAIGLPNNGGKYILKTAFENNKISISQHKQFSKSIYSPEEYLYLKEFFSKIIQNQKIDLLLKKSN